MGPCLEELLTLILVVDDEPDILNLVGIILRTNGYQVNLASSGEKALESIQENKPDIIIADLFMPEMNGLELCTRIKANKETDSIPIIMFSALSRTVEQEQAKDVGVDSYLNKPFEISELLEAVGQYA